MSTIDQFESVFRSAIKPSYDPQPLSISKILWVSDLDKQDAEPYAQACQEYLTDAGSDLIGEVSILPKELSHDLNTLIEEISKRSPDLIVTHRNLHSDASFGYTLGDHIEVLTQVTHVPILLCPHHSHWRAEQLGAPKKVMVLTDQLSANPVLIDAALSLVRDQGQITLAHIEDESQFNRFIDSISKIPELDTEIARSSIQAQLFKETEDFVEAIKTALLEKQREVTVHSEIQMGHTLRTYVSMVEVHQIDMVVMQSKVEDQVAIHGLSYPLAVELDQLPMLLL